MHWIHLQVLTHLTTWHRNNTNTDSSFYQHVPSIWSVSQQGQVRTRGTTFWQENVVFPLFVRKWVWWLPPSGLLCRAELWHCTFTEEITLIYDLMSRLSFVPGETKQMSSVLRESLSDLVRKYIHFWTSIHPDVILIYCTFQSIREKLTKIHLRQQRQSLRHNGGPSIHSVG